MKEKALGSSRAFFYIVKIFTNFFCSSINCALLATCHVGLELVGGVDGDLAHLAPDVPRGLRRAELGPIFLQYNNVIRYI